MRILLASIILVSVLSCKDKNGNPPILILGTDENFGTYTGEILKAEGLNEFRIDSFSIKITREYLRNFNIVILSENNITAAQRELLTEYVKEGGSLIAFKPDLQFASLFGLLTTGEITQEGYIKIDTSKKAGRGLISSPLQYHGISDLYKLDDSEMLAELYSCSELPLGYPALVFRNFGKGHAAAFTYNLPKSIVYTRQGNPEWAGEERDKVDGPTATDLFYPKKGEKQWNDPSKIAIPQADEQMRLLTRVIETVNENYYPLPKFWYFPDQLKSIFIFTIDGEDSKEEDINNEILDVQEKGGNATLYEIGTYIKPETVAKWREDGNEVAIHYNDVPNYADPTYCNMDVVLDTMTTNFKNVYGYLPVTTRNHWVVWVSRDSTGKKEFAQQAELEAKYGMGFDCNYYQFGGNKVYPNWLGDAGHLNGSGLPMNFVRSDGRILNIYQSNTQLPDETWLKENIEGKSKIMIDRSLYHENYTWINANYHTWYWKECREPGMRVLDYCKTRGVPVWTAEKAYQFLKMKDEASFNNISWSENCLTFLLKSSLKHTSGLTFYIPAFFNGLTVQKILRNGTPQTLIIDQIKGKDYAFITVQAGRRYNFSVLYR